MLSSRASSLSAACSPGSLARLARSWMLRLLTWKFLSPFSVVCPCPIIITTSLFWSVHSVVCLVMSAVMSASLVSWTLMPSDFARPSALPLLLADSFIACSVIPLFIPPVSSLPAAADGPPRPRSAPNREASSSCKRAERASIISCTARGSWPVAAAVLAMLRVMFDALRASSWFEMVIPVIASIFASSCCEFSSP